MAEPDWADRVAADACLDAMGPRSTIIFLDAHRRSVAAALRAERERAIKDCINAVAESPLGPIMALNRLLNPDSAPRGEEGK